MSQWSKFYIVNFSRSSVNCCKTCLKHKKIYGSDKNTLKSSKAKMQETDTKCCFRQGTFIVPYTIKPVMAELQGTRENCFSGMFPP